MIHHVVESPFFLGIMLLLLNVGSRFVVHEFSSSDEEYSQNVLLRRLTVFAVCFVGTRNLIVSLLLTAGFVVLASGFLRNRPEGMANPDKKLRTSAGLPAHVDSPAYDKDIKAL